MFYIVSDIHGHIRLSWLKEGLQQYDLSTDDYLIITGDAGICWNSEQNKMVMDFYNSLPCITLFVDGNHEDFNILYDYPIVDLYEGKAHKISDKIFHLMRGETFKINNKTLFCFGGGFSAKVLTNTSPIFVWKEELPIDSEYQNGLVHLKVVDNKVDLIFSHCAPMSIVDSNGFAHYPNDMQLLDYLENIYHKVTFSHWYYGHYHKDFDNGKFSCIYNRIIKVEE